MTARMTSKMLLNLAFSHFHYLSRSNFNAAILLDAGIRRVAFLRHSNTASAPPNKVDFDRQLTPKGESQAKTAGFSFGSTLRPFYPHVLCSTAPRCVATANIFLDAALANAYDEHPQLNLVSNLYDGTMQPEGSRLFKKHGYVPLRTYLEDPDVQDSTTAKKVLGTYARHALDAITELVTSDTTNRAAIQPATTLLFVGHAVYLPSAALALASAYVEERQGSSKEWELILDTNTKEAEGYLVDIHTPAVSLLCRPKESATL